jgi:hypothetical protein
VIKVAKAAMVGEDDLHGEDGGDKEYFYDDWGVDYVDLDFHTGKNNEHCSST